MDFESLLVDSSRAVADMAVQAVCCDPSLVKQLVDLALQDKGQVSSRAGRALYLAAETCQCDIHPYANRIIRAIYTAKSEGLKKNFLRLLTIYTFTGEEKDLGTFVDYCMRCIVAYDETPAVRIHCMRILANLTQQIPELRHELIAAIESGMPYGSTGFKSFGKKTIAGLNRQ